MLFTECVSVTQLQVYINSPTSNPSACPWTGRKCVVSQRALFRAWTLKSTGVFPLTSVGFWSLPLNSAIILVGTNCLCSEVIFQSFRIIILIPTPPHPQTHSLPNLEKGLFTCNWSDFSCVCYPGAGEGRIISSECFFRTSHSNAMHLAQSHLLVQHKRKMLAVLLGSLLHPLCTCFAQVYMTAQGEDSVYSVL